MREEEIGNYFLMGTEFVCFEKVLEMDSGDGCTTFSSVQSLSRV